MNRGRFNQNGKQPPTKNKSVRERLEQAQTARQAQLERNRKVAADRAAQAQAEEARRAARPKRDAARYCKTLSSIPFWMSGEPDSFNIAEPYLALVRIAVSSMNDESRHAVLCWPNFHPSPAAVPILLSLADNGSTDPINEGEKGGGRQRRGKAWPGACSRPAVLLCLDHLI